MEKIINIDGRDIRLKSNAALLLRYKMQFGKDALGAIMKMDEATKSDGIIDADKLDTEVFYNLLWVMAKTAEPGIAPPLEWFGEFESIPFNETVQTISELLQACLQTKKK